MLIYFILALSLINQTGVIGSRVVLSLYTLDLGAQPFTVGMLAATFSAFPMLLALTTGKAIDRFGSRGLLMFGSVATGLGMLVPYFAPGLTSAFIAGLMSGLSMVVFNVSTQNLVGLLSTTENRARNFSNYSLMNATSNFIGPLVAGFSIEHSGHVTACLYIAAISLVPLAMVGIWGRWLRGDGEHVHSTGGGIRAMLVQPGVRRVLAAGSLQNFAENLFQYYMPVYTHALGLSASTIGILLALNSAAAFVVRTVLPRLIARFKEEKVLAYGFYVGAASLMLIPFFKTPIVLGLVSFAFGLGMGCCGPIVTMLMFVNSPPGRSAESLGLKMTVNHLTKVVSPMLFGVVASAFGLAPVFWLNAIFLGAGGILSAPKKGT